MPIPVGRDRRNEEPMTTTSQPHQIVQKLWNYCNLLRDDGLSYGDYVEQLTFLLFLKMADEQTKPPYSKPSLVPEKLGWQSLLARDGVELESHYRRVLEELGRQPGMLGMIFRKVSTSFKMLISSLVQMLKTRPGASSASAANRLARATSSTKTKSRLWPPSPSMTGGFPFSKQWMKIGTAAA